MSVAEPARRRLLGGAARSLMLAASGLGMTMPGPMTAASGVLALAAASAADAHDSVGPVVPASSAPTVTMITDRRAPGAAACVAAATGDRGAIDVHRV